MIITSQMFLWIIKSSEKENVMKKCILLLETVLILIGLAGCSMTKERYDPYGVVEYLENKYDDEVRYF